MSDHDEVERVPAEADFDLSRRALLRLGLLSAAAAAHGVGVLPPGVAAEDAKPGMNLIGKLEGPELITDPAQFPKTFKEAPALAELVKAGKLPQRLDHQRVLPDAGDWPVRG